MLYFDHARTRENFSAPISRDFVTTKAAQRPRCSVIVFPTKERLRSVLRSTDGKEILYQNISKQMGVTYKPFSWRRTIIDHSITYRLVGRMMTLQHGRCAAFVVTKSWEIGAEKSKHCQPWNSKLELQLNDFLYKHCNQLLRIMLWPD